MKITGDVSLQLSVYLMLTWNSQSSSLFFWSAGITGVYNHTWLYPYSLKLQISLEYLRNVFLLLSANNFSII
jgi:hypothetical protein